MYSLRLREMVVNAKRTPVCWGDPFLPLPSDKGRGHYLATAVTTAQRLMHAIVAARPTELLRFWWTPDRRIQTSSPANPTLIHIYTCIFEPLICSTVIHHRSPIQFVSLSLSLSFSFFLSFARLSRDLKFQRKFANRRRGY